MSDDENLSKLIFRHSKGPAPNGFQSAAAASLRPHPIHRLLSFLCRHERSGGGSFPPCERIHSLSRHRTAALLPVSSPQSRRVSSSAYKGIALPSVHPSGMEPPSPSRHPKNTETRKCKWFSIASVLGNISEVGEKCFSNILHISAHSINSFQRDEDGTCSRLQDMSQRECIRHPDACATDASCVRMAGCLLPLLRPFCRLDPTSRELTTVSHMASVNSGPFFLQSSANSTNGHALTSPSHVAFDGRHAGHIPNQSIDVAHV